jgi:hypothetical protein
MNGSLLQDKKFLYFAQNEHSLAAPDNETLIPPHTSNSGPIVMDFMNPKAIYPLCLDKLNLPNRVLNNHWVFYVLGTLLCITLCLIFFTLRNEQPLKSRFIGPVFGFLMYGLSLSADFWHMQYNFDIYTHYACFIQIFITYPMIQMNIVLPTLILIRYSIILQLYLHKADFIKKSKELQRSASTMVMNNTTNSSSFLTRMDSKWKSFQENSIKVQIELRLRQILLFLQNPWSLVIVPMIWNILFIGFLLTLFTINKFYCEASTVLLARNFHLAILGIAAMIFAFFFILDMLFSIRNFIRCRWKKYFLEEDPFHFRLDFISLIFFVPVFFIWFLVPMPHFMYTLLNEFLFICGILLLGGIATIITIVKKIIFNIKSSRVSNERLKVNIQTILKNERLLEKFVEFTELEWSSENIYFKIDLEDYKKKNDLKSKRNIALKIKENYLMRNVSPLEINVTGKSLNPVLKQIEEQDFTNDLFDKVDSEVDVNLCDSLARFIISYQFDEYLKENEERVQKMGL